MVEQPITFKNHKGLQLVGMVHIPRSKPPFPTVILIPGLSGDKVEGYRRYVRLARRLCNEGMAVYRFDLTGHGDSEGAFEEITYVDLIEDCRDIFEFVRSQKIVKRNKIGVLNRSMCMGLHLKMTLKEIQCMVLEAPSAYPKETIEGAYGKAMRLGKAGRHSGFILSPDFYKDLDKYDPISSIRRTNVPILIIHGEEDDACDVGGAYELYENANDPKKLAIIKHAGHDFAHPELTLKLHNLEVDWFKKWLL